MWLSLLFVMSCALVARAAAPTGCTDINGLYECDYSTVSKPISSASFSNPPAQLIRLVVSGATTMSSAIFNSDFNNLDQSATFDPNFPATLEIKCLGNAAITIQTAALTNMGHVYDFKVINCQLTAGIAAFQNLGTLDRFIIENGTIASFDAAALQGISVEKSAAPTHDFPISTGALIFKDSKMTGGLLPMNFLHDQTNMVSLTLEGLDVTTLDSNLLNNKTSLRHLSLGYNTFTELPANLFTGLDSLAELHMYDTKLDCDCSKLWFYEHADTTKMKIYGDVICSTPTSWENKKAAVFYYSTCITVPATCSGGLSLMGACITWFEVGMYGMCVVAFILAIVVLVLAILTKKKAGEPGSQRRRPGPRGGPRRRPAPRGAPKTKMGWPSKK